MEWKHRAVDRWAVVVMAAELESMVLGSINHQLLQILPSGSNWFLFVGHMVRNAITATQNTACLDDQVSDAMLSCCYFNCFAQSQSMLAFLDSAFQSEYMLVFPNSALCWKTACNFPCHLSMVSMLHNPCFL